MVTIREICDDKSSISSTRWGFAAVIKFDIFIIFTTVLAGIIAHFAPGVEDFDSSFYTSIAMLLGILTGFISTAKALQGFEPKRDKHDEVPEQKSEEIEEEK